MPTPVNDFKTFGVGPGDDATSQADYQIATWRVEGWRSGILPHQQINKVLRQTSTIASAFAQAVADLTQQDMLDGGDVTLITNRIKTAFSAYLPYNAGTTYPVGSIGWAIQSGQGGATMTAAQIRAVLTGQLTAAEFSSIINGRLNLIDAPTTGLVTKVSDLTTAYGSTVAAATSATNAAAAQVAAETARNQAAVSAGAALTSQTNAATAATTATTAQGAASTSATQSANSATSAAGSATTATNSATTASNAATAAGNSATAAASSASTANTQATNAGTSANSASTSATTATTQAANASTSATTASGAATTATGAASTATTQAGLAATSASNAQSSATAASTSASTASTQATNAGNSAATATTAANTATTKAADATSAAAAAASSASSALSSSNAAGSSATAANTSAVTATASKDTAVAAAGTATGAASTATTQAAAAVVSATAASASATDAQTAANASQSSRLAAESAQGAASSSASQAANSVTTAQQAASSATSASGAAASAQTVAGGYATAANSSAVNAAAFATNSFNSAIASADWYNQTVAATGDLSAQVTQESNTRASQIAGVHAQLVFKTVATRSDGKRVLAAIGLASTAPNDATGGQSEILMQADRLVFVPSNDINADPKNAFVVGQVNGVTTIVVAQAVIGDTSILPRAILTPNLSAINADLGAVTAGTITLNTAGFIRGGQTDFDAGAGFFLGRGVAAPDFCFSLKADDGSFLKWSKAGGLQIGGAALVTSAGAVNDFGIVSVLSQGNTGLIRCGIKLASDGRILEKYSNGGTYDYYGRNWYPTATGIGASFWARVTSLGPDAITSGTVGTWQQISGEPTFELARSTSGISMASLSVKISTSSTGVPIVGNGSFSFEVERL